MTVRRREMVERRKGQSKLVYNKTKQIIEKISPILCNDMMSWEDLADRVLELEAELSECKRLLRQFQNAEDRNVSHRRP
jgi:hypothetical protein